LANRVAYKRQLLALLALYDAHEAEDQL